MHGGNHVIGGTTSGLKFLQNIASYIPGTFVGYLSSLLGNLFYTFVHIYCYCVFCILEFQDSYATRPVKSSAEHSETLGQEVEGDSKDELRRGVESLFNTLYGMICISVKCMHACT